MADTEWCSGRLIIDGPKLKANGSAPTNEQRRFQAKRFRCPVCNKRLRPRANFCCNGYCFDCWSLPAHKPK